MRGLLLSPELYAQLRRVVREVLTEMKNPGENRARLGNVANKRWHVILDEAIPAATAFDDNPGVGSVTLYRREKSSGNLVTTGKTLDVVNRTDIDGTTGAYGRIERIDGEWSLYVLNCGAAPT